jgi:integrase
MKGHVRRRGKASWAVVLDLGRDGAGKRRQKWHSVKGTRFHDLRHTHATQLLRQGVHPKIVSERLGHSNIGITLDTYSHVLPGMQEDAIAAFDASLRVSLASAKSRQDK